MLRYPLVTLRALAYSNDIHIDSGVNMPDVLSQHPLETTGIIYTLGMSNRDIEEFIDLLKIYDIQILIDVRRFPTSKFEWFKRKNLPRALARQMIGYVFLGKELGGYRKEGYDVHLSTKDFQKGLEKIESIAIYDRVAIICSERMPWKCHRWLIARILKERGWEVLHIIEEDRVWTAEGHDEDIPLYEYT